MVMRLDGDSVVEKVLQPDNALRALAAAGSEQTVGEAGAAAEDPESDPRPEESNPPAQGAAESGGARPGNQDEFEDEERERTYLDDYAGAMQELREGDIIRGTVVQIDSDGAMVDVRTKSEGIIPRAEVEALGEDELQVGQEVMVFVVRIEDEDGHLILSKRQADYERGWQEIIEAEKSGEILTATVSEAVRGGLIVDLDRKSVV